MSESSNKIIDVNVLATPQKVMGDFDETVIEYDLINSINVWSKDVTVAIRNFDVWGQNKLGLQSVVAKLLSAPKDLIQINCNRELNRMTFPSLPSSESDFNFFNG
jgi:hypothetical protein